MRHFRIHEALPSEYNGGYGLIYVIELNPPELLRLACMEGIQAGRVFGMTSEENKPAKRLQRLREGPRYIIPNSKARMVLRHWIVGRYRKRTRELTIAQAEDLINRLKAGEEVKPDYSRKEKLNERQTKNRAG